MIKMAITPNQRKALKAFRIPDAEIEAMTFEQAREKIGSLITQVKHPHDKSWGFR